MKKTIAFFVSVIIIMTFSTCVFAVDKDSNIDSAFNFDNLLPDIDSTSALIFGNDLTGMVREGFWFANLDNSSWENIWSTTTFHNVPTFLFTPHTTLINTTVTSYIIPAAKTTEINKEVRGVFLGINKAKIPLHSFSNQLTDMSGYTIGYVCENNLQIVRDNSSFKFMTLYINSDKIVYPIIVVNGSELSWDEKWPKNNQELTTILNDFLNTEDNYTFYITPIIDSGIVSRSKNSSGLGRKLRYTFSATSTIGGAISDAGENLFSPDNFNQIYTIKADKDYTIHYVVVDGKIVNNTINCGNIISLKFDAIYGNRSIHAVFKKK